MKLQRKKRKLDVMGRGNTKKESVFPRTGILGTCLKKATLEYLAAKFLEFSQFGCLT